MEKASVTFSLLQHFPNQVGFIRKSLQEDVNVEERNMGGAEEEESPGWLEVRRANSWIRGREAAVCGYGQSCLEWVGFQWGPWCPH